MFADRRRYKTICFSLLSFEMSTKEEKKLGSWIRDGQGRLADAQRVPLTRGVWQDKLGTMTTRKSGIHEKLKGLCDTGKKIKNTWRDILACPLFKLIRELEVRYWYHPGWKFITLLVVCSNFPALKLPLQSTKIEMRKSSRIGVKAAKHCQLRDMIQPGL